MADWTLHRGSAPRRKIPLWVEPCGVPYDLSRRESRAATMRLRGGKVTGEWLTVYRGPVGAHPLLWDLVWCANE